MKKEVSTSRLIAVTSFSNLITTGVSILSGLLVAKILLPEQLGLFNSFTLFTSYIILMQIGIPNGLSREIPFLFGKNEFDLAKNYAAVAQFFSLTLGGVIFLLSVLAAFYYVFNSNYIFAIGSIIVGVTSFQTLYVAKYLRILYRTNLDFKRIALVNIIVAFFSLLTILLVWKYEFYGLCLRVIILALVDWFFCFLWRPIKVKPKWNYFQFKELLKVGTPIFLVASVYGLWPTIQRTLIVLLGGVYALGLFALAIIVQNVLAQINNSINTVTFPKMSFEYGKGTSFIEVLKIPSKFVMYSLLIFSAIALVGWWLLPVLVHYFLPNYIEGIEAAKWMLLVSVISVFGTFSSIYVVLKRNMDRLKSYSIGVLVWALFVYVFYSINGFSLILFPQAMILGYLSTYLVDGYNYYSYYKKSLNPLNKF